MKNLRKLKIHTKYKPGLYRGTPISGIRLEGKWLNKLGFNQGQMVTIQQEEHRLIITIDKEQNGLSQIRHQIVSFNLKTCQNIYFYNFIAK